MATARTRRQRIYPVLDVLVYAILQPGCVPASLGTGRQMGWAIRAR